jgi:beta-N-acetylglucosaminidase
MPVLNFPVYAADTKSVEKSTSEKEYVVFTDKNIKTEDMRKKSNLDEKKLTEYMKKFPNLAGIEETLLEVQDDYNVNAILILAIVRLESGNGKSQIAKTKNNLGGIIASSKSVRVYRSFDTKSDCIIYMAKLLSEHYLTEGGKYHNGYTLPDIAKRYSTASDKWTDLVQELMYEIQKGIDKIKL